MRTARIVVLGIAIASGTLAMWLVGRGAPAPAPLPAPRSTLETTEILVARTDIGAGMAIAAQHLDWAAWPAASASHLIRRSERPDAIAELSRTYARAAFAAGEPIRENRLAKGDAAGYMAAILPPGRRAAAIEIKPETGAGGFIMPGDHVDVILYRRNTEKAGGNEAHLSETILRNIRVLAIDQTFEDANGQKSVIGRTATLELTPHQAETLALGREIGTLSLALRSTSDIAQGAEEMLSRGAIHVIRHGISTRMAK
jgi:pilus assembly protein CpaB